jgi:hypothetical protein
MGPAYGHVHKATEKKERNSGSEVKNRRNVTCRVHKEISRKPANTGLAGHEKGGQRKSVPPHLVVDGLPLRNFLFALKHASEY